MWFIDKLLTFRYSYLSSFKCHRSCNYFNKTINLKIFLSFLQGKANHPIPAYSFWEYYIKNGVEEAGHTWVECPSIDWAYGLVPQSKESFNHWKTQVWEKTVEYLRKHPVDLFLSYLYPSQIDVQAIKKIQDLNIPCVNFFCDNVREFREIPKQFEAFDLNWVPEFKALALYKNTGCPYIHLPMPMWVAPQLRINKHIENSSIAFIGSKDVQRQLLFEKILNSNPGLDLAIYGSGWKEQPVLNNNRKLQPRSLIFSLNSHLSFIKELGITAYLRKTQQRNLNVPYSDALKSRLKGKPSRSDYITITQNSIITLGVNRYPSFRFPMNKPDSYSRLRDIEAPMLGACYLTEWTEGLEYMYDIGEEISVYRTVEEFNEITIRLKNDKIKRKRIKLNGQKKALSQLSIPRSLEQLFQKVNGKL